MEHFFIGWKKYYVYRVAEMNDNNSVLTILQQCIEMAFTLLTDIEIIAFRNIPY